MPTRTPGWPFGLLVLVMTSLLMLVAIEGVLRALDLGHPGFSDRDPFVGWSHRAGASGVWHKEGGVYVEISPQGRRDRDRPIEKPEGAYRIAVLGDSYAEALQVELDETFFVVLEQRLRESGFRHGAPIEVLNFGVSGYGTAQALLSYRHRARETDPDLVLLAFTTGNDLYDNVRELDGQEGRPYFVLEGESLVLDDSFRESASYGFHETVLGKIFGFLRRNFRSFQLMRDVLVNARRPTPPVVEDSAIVDERGIHPEGFSAPRDEAWKKAWAVTEAMILQLDREVRADDRRFALVILSNGIQVHPDPQVRERFMEHFGIDDLFYPDRRLTAFAEAHDIAVLALAPGFRQYAQSTGAFLHGFEGPTGLGRGHWNELGHRLAGERIADWLEAQSRAWENQENPSRD